MKNKQKVEHVMSHSNGIFMPKNIWDRYDETVGEWVDVTPYGERWKVLWNQITGEVLDCNKFYNDWVES